MRQEIEQAVQSAVDAIVGADIVHVELTRPDEQFGDYATNAALQLAGTLHRKPREVAEDLATKVHGTLGDRVAEVSVAGPGFINITLSDSELVTAMSVPPEQGWAGKTIVTEYSDPNPFKVLHAGHLYTSIVGDSISNLLERSGGMVHRVNFGGDVGLHVAKTMWAIMRELGGEHPAKLSDVPEHGRSEWMAAAYVAGTNAYEDDAAAKTEIIELNKRVYRLFADDDHESAFAQVYWTCRQWSYDYFNAFYDRIGTPFEKYYPESECAPIGLKTVQEQLAKGVYQKSDGAVVFDGEKYGLHTRVFVNSQGLPTYETKDVGLIMRKWDDYHYDRSVVITGSDIVEYMKVVMKSIEQYAPELVKRQTHLTHGNVKLQGGVKMSSRKGNFLRAVDVLDAAVAANKAATGRDDEQVILGAVKYSFLKQRLGADIIFLPEESVSLEGNSGPYLQYAHARARSILAKSKAKSQNVETLEPAERRLVRKIAEYPEVVRKATAELLPHYICTYLYELAQVFNSFYEHNRVVGDPREAARVQLIARYAGVLKDGLGLLGIAAPDHM